jgi:cyclopropane fatty-acyl-phospholipid synthase-like methyltransferase
MAAAACNPYYAGGHLDVTHVDRGALQYLASLGCRSLLDVGCGPGGQVVMARELGWRAIGIDVDLVLYRRPGVALIDLAVEPVILPAPADVVWSVETAEHIPPQHVAAYVETLVQNTGRYLVMTSSDRIGPWHLNPQPVGYWEQRIVAAGLVEKSDLLLALLRASTMQREFLRATGRVYGRADS